MNKNEPFGTANVVFVPSISVPAMDIFGATPLPTVTGLPKEVLESRPKKLKADVTDPAENEANGLVVVLTSVAPSATLKAFPSVVTNVAPPDELRYGPVRVSEVPL
jgi:hypothetical protein